MGKAEDVRQKILDAARGLVRETGRDTATMRGIANRIGYTAAALYHHFENKEALLSALVAEDFRALMGAFVRLGEIEDPVVRLVRAAEEYVEFGLRHPEEYRLAFMRGPYNRPESPEDQVVQEYPAHSTYEFLRVVCEEAIAADRFRPELDDPDEVAQMVWSTLHGLVAIRISRGTDPAIGWKDARRTGLRTCATLIRGMSRESGDLRR